MASLTHRVRINHQKCWLGRHPAPTRRCYTNNFENWLRIGQIKNFLLLLGVQKCRVPNQFNKIHWRYKFQKSYFLRIFFNSTPPVSTAIFSFLAVSTVHPVHWTVYITHCTWTWKYTGNCICTLHTTHWTLFTTCRPFILHAVHLSLHTDTSKSVLVEVVKVSTFTHF